VSRLELFLPPISARRFRVIAPLVLMKAFANDLTVAHNHAADMRVRTGQADAFACQG